MPCILSGGKIYFTNHRMTWLADNWLNLILILAGIHFAAFVGITLHARRNDRSLEDYLKNLVSKPIRERDSNEGIQGSIQAFIGDIREILTNPARSGERREFSERLKHRKPGLLYAERTRFDVVQNVAHSFVEAYPVLGIMGTILAISAGLQSPAGADGGPAVMRIVESFQIAIDTTLWGLGFAVLFSLLRAWQEPGLATMRRHRDVVSELLGEAERTFALSDRGDA